MIQTKKKKTLLRNSLIFSLVFLITVFFLSETSSGPFRRRLGRYIARIKLESLDPFIIPGKDRLLIIAPHPDDETIAAAGIIQKAKRNHDSVRVVLITNGDGFGDVLDETIIARFRSADHGIKIGYKRQLESIRAMKHLGLSRADITFLGYPDGGISQLWFDNWSKPYYSVHTKSTSSPYDNSYSLDCSYTGESLSNDIANILDAYKPTLIITPSYYDFHPDHRCSTNFIISELEKFRKNNVKWVDSTKVYYYLVHNGKLRWPRPWGYQPNQPLAPPESLSNMNLDWFHFLLDKEAVYNKKIAMDEYKSQIKLIGDYMNAFVRSEELFAIHYWNGQTMLDPAGDFITKDLLKGGDFVSLTEKKDQDHMILTVETLPKGFPGIISYFMRIVFYERKEDGEIIETRGKWRLQKGNTIFQNNRFEITIPNKDYPGLFGCFVTIESFPRFSSILIDKIPWSFFRLK
jgi:LmbE family N-acetylglucosaminyl deacetylase